MNEPKPALLYVCPVMPATTGNGLAMRCGMVLEALSAHYRISLLVVALYPPSEPDVPEVFRAQCENVAVVPASANPESRTQQASPVYRESVFDTVHVHRLAAIPFARPYFAQSYGRPRLHLDLDDIESKTYRRIAALYRSDGNLLLAERAESTALRSLLLEATAFRIFDRIYVCSELDREVLRDRLRTEVRLGPPEICVLRNAVRMPAIVRPPLERDDYRFLFVGNLQYYPNQDAVQYFCREVLPLIRVRAPRAFRLEVIGANPASELMDLSGADVHVVGPVPDVQRWYQDCDAVVVPLRAGGGTRIKILEAFSYQRPVVSTSIGMEGIDAEPDRHLLRADEPEEFAAACIRLMSDHDLANHLVQNAKSLLAQFHVIEALEKAVSPASCMRVSDARQSSG